MPRLPRTSRAALAALAAAAGALATPGAAASAPADEVIVAFAGEGAALQAAAARRHDARIVRRLMLPGVAVVEARGGRSAAALASELARDPRVRFAEPNGVVRRLLVPDDPRFGSQWGLENTGQRIGGITGMAGADIDAPDAWDVTTGSSAVRIAVLDGGVDRTVPDLAPNALAVVNAGESGSGRENNGVDDDGNGLVDDVAGWDWVSGDNDPDDEDFVSHGTHVAGVMAARGGDGQGMAGVAWSASLISLRVLNPFGIGFVSDVAEGLAYAGSRGARVVNVSLGGNVSGRTMQEAMEAYPNTLFVVAAGNDSDDNDGPSPSMPCALPSANLICVSATDQGDDPAGFSNVGATTVDLAAPGVNVLGTTRGGGFQLLDGTSFSAPHVAGVAALILAREPTASTAQVKRALMDGAEPMASLAGTSVTDGRLDAPGALASVPPPGAAPGVSGPVVREVGADSVRLASTIEPDGPSPTTYHLEWGPDTSYGNVTTVRGVGPSGLGTTVIETIDGLQPGTTYHARIVAADIDGIAAGPDVAFTTAAGTSTPSEEPAGDGGPGPPGADAPPPEADPDDPPIGRPTAGPARRVRVGFRRRDGVWRAVLRLPEDAVVSGRLRRAVIRPPRVGRSARRDLVSVRGFRRRGYRAGVRQIVLGSLRPGTHRLELRLRSASENRSLTRTFRVRGPVPRARLAGRGGRLAVLVTATGGARVAGSVRDRRGVRVAALRPRRVGRSGRVSLRLPPVSRDGLRVRLTVWEAHRVTRLALSVPDA